VDAQVWAAAGEWWGAPTGMVVGTKSAHALSFATGGSSKVTIDPRGNVGIGTRTPQHGRLVIEDDAVPLAVREAGQSPTAGGLWRMPLDAGVWRFDANTAAVGDFSSYRTPLSMYPTGNVGIGGNLNVAGQLRWGRSVANPDSIELGAPDGGTPGMATPFIDFHFRGLAQDYNTRIINDENGQLTISASTLRTLGNLSVQRDITLGAGHTFSAPGRLHISGAEILYLLNNQGVVISKAWGGNGNLTAEGTVRIADKLGTSGFPPAPRNPKWGGGLHTWDVEAEGTIWSMHGYDQGSDARMKANVAKLDNVLDKLDAIRGVSFERIPLGAPTARAEQRRDIGVIAQEVETVFPELVSVHGHEDNKAVNYSGLTGVLIESVKELKAQNEELRSRFEALDRA
jgi:hypothetical protein